MEVVPLELHHKLWLQDCFDALSGLGQYEDLTLENEEQQERIDEFIAAMREHNDSVQFFNLTLDSLLERVILPERDRLIFVKMMQEKLGIKSTAEPIVDYLGEGVQGLLAEKARLEREEQRLLAEKEKLGRENESTHWLDSTSAAGGGKAERELREARKCRCAVKLSLHSPSELVGMTRARAVAARSSSGAVSRSTVATCWIEGDNG